MYINAQTVITAAAVLGAAATLLGGLSAVHSWYQRQNKQDEDIRAMKEEMCLLTYGVLACLKGLKEMGQNGTVTEAIDKIEKHMNHISKQYQDRDNRRKEENMNVNEIMQYLSYLLIAIGVMAFIVSVVTQVIKSWPGLDKLPTSAVVIVLSLVLCPVSFVAMMAWLKQPIRWYMVFACMIAAFVVALVSMDGWERVKEIWERTGYKEKK